MNILIYGIGGTMGQIVYNCLKDEKDITACCGVDKMLEEHNFDIPVFASCNEVKMKVDCIIDFSVPQCIYDYIPFAIKNKIPCVVATTGLDDKQQEYIDNASKEIAIFQTGNMSMGVSLMIKLVKNAAAMLGDKADIEIIEMHHNKKVDAPSGTAKMLANAIKAELPSSTFLYGRNGIVGRRNKNEVGIHAVRGGSIVGKHDVMFVMNNEVIKVSHESQSKVIFAQGSINAARFLLTKNNGIYDMEDLLDFN